MMNILAIGSHPDDIEFGCGGTLLKYSLAGNKVSLLVLTDGEFGADPNLRKKEQEAAVDIMGAKGLFWGGFRDTELVDNRELILKIEEVTHQVAPDIVFLNYWDDVHQDHRSTAQAGVSATRYIKEVLFYEVPTTQHFEPDIFVDINDVLEKKLELLKAHASQVDRTRVQNLTILESVQSCANFRGFQGRCKFAEGFRALRVLKRID
ncbi:MAG: PIG-L family deacetylase [Candidatus Omnitrophica bacterium]|nr:PIG-L family deacetylase [Candidatus Omnitrophota bacterium]MDD5238615.1 PIG-L family deacetylase [Candidatus Omnitrophota bacterium]